jgi:hypothetical protein
MYRLQCAVQDELATREEILQAVGTDMDSFTVHLMLVVLQTEALSIIDPAHLHAWLKSSALV